MVRFGSVPRPHVLRDCQLLKTANAAVVDLTHHGTTCYLSLLEGLRPMQGWVL